MFGIDGSEFLIIILVAVVVIGPKDMPKMLRAFAHLVARLRSMAQEFRGQFDEAIRRADMQDTIDDLKGVSKSVKDLDPRQKLRDFYASLEEETSLEKKQRDEAENFYDTTTQKTASNKPVPMVELVGPIAEKYDALSLSNKVLGKQEYENSQNFHH